MESIWKAIKRNRYSVLAMTLTIVTLLVPMTGCLDGKVHSSITGQVSTASEIKAAGQAKINELLAEREKALNAAKLFDSQIGQTAELTNADIEAANLKTEYNYGLWSDLSIAAVNNPWVQNALGVLGIGGIATALATRLDKKRADSLVTGLKVENQALKTTLVNNGIPVTPTT